MITAWCGVLASALSTTGGAVRPAAASSYAYVNPPVAVLLVLGYCVLFPLGIAL